MKGVIILVRTLLGLAFVVSGLNGFLDFLKLPSPPSPAAGFLSLLTSTGYIFVIKVLEVLGGAMLLAGTYVPLGLVLLTPIIVNIVLYEVFMLRKPGPGLILILLAAFVIWGYRSHFLPLFAADAKIGA